MFIICLIFTNVSFAQVVRISDQGAYNIYQRIVLLNKSSNKYTIGTLEKKDIAGMTYYGMSMNKGKYGFRINLDVNDDGFVSKIYATNLDPILSVDGIKNDKSVNEYYQDVYRDVLLNQRHSTYTAERIAQQSAESYQREKIKKIDGLLHMYGINGYGRINPIGARLLGMMVQETNYESVANFYANLYRQQVDGSPAPTSQMLTRNICEQLTVVFSALGMSYNECVQMVNNSQNGFSSAWCSALNRRICLNARTTSGGSIVEINITASDQ